MAGYRYAPWDLQVRPYAIEGVTTDTGSWNLTTRHRIALRPTPEQESLFLQHAGYARFAYNWAVRSFRLAWSGGMAR